MIDKLLEQLGFNVLALIGLSVDLFFAYMFFTYLLTPMEFSGGFSFYQFAVGCVIYRLMVDIERNKK